MTDPTNDQPDESDTPTEPVAAMTIEEQVADLSYDQVQQELADAGLPATGKSDVLRARLLEHLTNPTKDDGDNAQGDGGAQEGDDPSEPQESQEAPVERTYVAAGNYFTKDGRGTIQRGELFQAYPDDPRVKAGSKRVEDEAPTAEQLAQLEAFANGEG